MQNIIGGIIFDTSYIDPHVNKGWVGFDLDGTLAYHGEWKGIEHVGEPIMPMVERLKSYLAKGIEVRIVTARVGGHQSMEDVERARFAIVDWCMKHFGVQLKVTASKDYQMLYLYDDRCRQVVTNTGKVVGE